VTRIDAAIVVLLATACATREGCETVRPLTDSGVSSDVQIFARCAMNRTGLAVAQGDRLRLEVVSIEDWRDAGVASTPAGHVRTPTYLDHAVARWFLRRPDAPWFALMATVDGSVADAWAVSACPQWTAPRTGELTLFVNDVPGFYCNNHGVATLRVTRVDHEEE
jgi:hypothetical protein